MNDIYFQTSDQLVQMLERANISPVFPKERDDLRVLTVNFVLKLLLRHNGDEGLYVTVREKPPQQFGDLPFFPSRAQRFGNV
jgi:hypothetical protein